MQTVIEFFKNFEILIGTFTGVLIALLASFNKISEIFKSKNTAIANELTEIKAVIFTLSENIQKFENDIFVMKQNFIPFNAYIKEKAVFDKLQSEIEKRKNYYITNVKELNNAFKSMIIEGCDESYKFFKNIRKNGYNNIDSDVITDSAIQVFRRIRSGQGGNINIDNEFKEHVKKNIAMPLIFELNTKLDKLKSGFYDGSEADVKIGKYNGGSDKELINIAVWFIDSIISNSINYMKK